jgi:acyl-CoA synthetase (AMP-forming)/AMP-acid ligase II
MYLKSPFPDPPVLPVTNAYNIFFKRPEQAQWPDFIVHIDVETEDRIMYREFTARIQDLATGLGAPPHKGGMGLRAESGEVVGIMGENSSVSSYLNVVTST